MKTPAEQEQNIEIHRLLVQIAELKKTIEIKDEQLSYITDSKSWKITAPLRFLTQQVSALSQSIPRWIWQGLKTIYRSLPFSQTFKVKCKRIVLNRFPWAAQYLAPHFKQRLLKKLQYIPIHHINLEEPLVFSEHLNPTVSVIIPVFNNIKYTYACLKSIANTPSKYNFEIIVVDDCSTDNTQEVLKNVTGIQLIKNEQNSGFIHTCNRGAAAAKGQYLLFLNNDTQVLPDWLDELVNTFSHTPNAGLVGSKLIYPNGQLQEAGCIIWQQGSAWNYGRGDDPNKPEYNYLREVDYCSGAAIMIPKTLFNEVGCFDERYVPAYCEDSDLAFAVREKGYKVLYQPLSQVIHFEGVTSGSDVTKGIKSYQIRNSAKFYVKWQSTLANHPCAKDDFNKLHLVKDKIKKRILFVDACTPTPDQDAGSVTALYYLKALIELGYQITFVPLDNFLNIEKYTSDLQRMGVECLYSPYVHNLPRYLKKYGKNYDVVMLHRAQYANSCIDSVRQYCPQTKVIFNTTDLHYLRLERQAEIENSVDIKKQAQEIKKIELDVMRKSDCTIVVSDIEKEILSKEDNGINLSLIPLILDIPGNKTDFANRKDIVFVGGYQHTPNVDAVLYFVKEIWPRVKEKLPEIKFYIVGSKVPANILALASSDVIVVGYVENLADYFDRCKLSIAPLRYGAGIKGKVGTSMAYGLPCVATPIAAEGMGLKHQENILIVDGAAEFADNIVTLYSDETLWNNISANGLAFVHQHYSLSAGKEKISQMLDSLST